MKNKKIYIGLILLLSMTVSIWAGTTWETGAYTNDANISQELSISNATSMTVIIVGETEENYDFIIITDANDNEVGRFSGDINQTLTVTGSNIIARLTSDGSITKSGVIVTVRGAGAGNTPLTLNELRAMIANGENVTHVNTSEITYMANLFHNNTDFNQDISGWDVSNVTNMHRMFADATSFNQDISDWRVSNVTSMFSMFAGATSFNQNISGWNVSNVTNHQSFATGSALEDSNNPFVPTSNDDTWVISPYQNNMDETRQLTTTDNYAYCILVHIDGETEENYDFLTITAGNDDIQEEIKISGIFNNRVIEVHTPTVNVNFKSDGSVTKSGVTVHVTSCSPEE